VHPVIAAARGATLVDRDGREYLDLSMGYGSVWLGHGEPAVARAVAAQLERYAAPGFLPFAALEHAQAALARCIPDTHVVGGIYSTGMEAVEAALRAVRAHTGRAHVAGFEGSEHGRSAAAAALGAAGTPGAPETVHRLPGLAGLAPAALGDALGALHARAPLAAVFVEPLQMTGGGQALEPAQCAALFEFARAHGCAVVFDEALTGLYRCGARLYADLLGCAPDVIVLGKGIGNGFPCAAVALRRGFAWDRARVRPGSTYWNHPLACAAIAATLGELERRPPGPRVAAIERVVRESLGGLELRGRGALWCLGFPDPRRQQELVRRVLEGGVVASYYDRFLRLLPPLCIEEGALRRACEAIRKAHAATFG
jgi:acetylornithine/succinyldiaminopimelate/putrescine aminotransferase